MSKPSSLSKWLPWMLLFALAFIWGSTFMVTKRALLVFGPIQVGLLRIFFAGLCLLPYALPQLSRLRKSHYRSLLITALVGKALPMTLLAVALAKLDSSSVGLLNATTPIFVLLTGRLFFQQKTSIGVTLGALLGLVGTGLVWFANSSQTVSFIDPHMVMVLLAVALYGTNLNFVKYALGELSPTTIASMSLLLLMPIAGGMLLLDQSFWLKCQQPGVYPALGYTLLLGVVSSALAAIWFNRLIQMASPVFTSSIALLLPLVAMAWGLWDGEVLLPTHYASAALILLGVYLIQRRGCA